MTVELFYLTLVTALTGLMWIPYVLDRLMVRGLIDAVGYPENPKPHNACSAHTPMRWKTSWCSRPWCSSPMPPA
jgi:hypothetical protein